jgi:hypothetical protein
MASEPNASAAVGVIESVFKTLEGAGITGTGIDDLKAKTTKLLKQNSSVFVMWIVSLMSDAQYALELKRTPDSTNAFDVDILHRRIDALLKKVDSRQASR